MKVCDVWEVTDTIFMINFTDQYGGYEDSVWIDDLDPDNFSYQAALECEVNEINVDDDVLIVWVSKDEFDIIQLTMMNNASTPDFNSAYPKDLVSGDITTDK